MEVVVQGRDEIELVELYAELHGFQNDQHWKNRYLLGFQPDINPASFFYRFSEEEAEKWRERAQDQKEQKLRRLVQKFFQEIEVALTEWQNEKSKAQKKLRRNAQHKKYIQKTEDRLTNQLLKNASLRWSRRTQKEYEMVCLVQKDADNIDRIFQRQFMKAAKESFKLESLKTRLLELTDRMGISFLEPETEALLERILTGDYSENPSPR